MNSVFSAPAQTSRNTKENPDCFYCHKPGHCLPLKRNDQTQAKSSLSQTKGVGFIDGTSLVLGTFEPVNDCFKPFLFDVYFLLEGTPGEKLDTV